MHRLLSFKGYVFPEISLSDAAVLNPTENFQSASEMEKEEREAQEAKLQELIRRGTPADLQEANRLMKIMSGFQENFTNYRAKVAEEVDKLRRKSEILEEMLNNTKEGDNIQEDDVFSDIVSTLKTSQPKIEKMIDEEKDDEDAVVKLLALNDRIQALLQKYNLLKKKDYQGASSVKVESSGLPKTANPNVSLIDFDDSPEEASASPPAVSGPSVNLIDQLNGLSFNKPSIQLPLSATNSGQSSNFLASTLAGSTTSASTASPNLLADLGFSPSPTPVQQQTSPNPSTPDYSAFRNLSPALNSPTISSPSVAAPAPAPAADEWTFSSAPTQPTATPKAHTVHAISDSLALTFTVTRSGPSTLQVHASFSNKSAQHVSNLNYQLAVPRAFSLKMQQQTSTSLAPFANNGVTQDTTIENATPGSNLKLRWRITADVGAVPYERQGVVDDFPPTL